MKVHYKTKSEFGFVKLCTHDLPEHSIVTTNWDKVDCKRCEKMRINLA